MKRGKGCGSMGGKSVKRAVAKDGSRRNSLDHFKRKTGRGSGRY